MLRAIPPAALAALLAISASPPLGAQTTLTGSVEGPDGEPLVGAVVTVRPLLDTALRTQVETDEIESSHPGNAHARRIAERARARMAD